MPQKSFDLKIHAVASECYSFKIWGRKFQLKGVLEVNDPSWMNRPRLVKFQVISFTSRDILETYYYCWSWLTVNGLSHILRPLLLYFMNLKRIERTALKRLSAVVAVVVYRLIFRFTVRRFIHYIIMTGLSRLANEQHVWVILIGNNQPGWQFVVNVLYLCPLACNIGTKDNHAIRR